MHGKARPEKGFWRPILVFELSGNENEVKGMELNLGFCGMAGGRWMDIVILVV